MDRLRGPGMDGPKLRLIAAGFATEALAERKAKRLMWSAP